MFVTYLSYVLYIIVLLLVITLPLHNRCMLKYTIFIPLLYFVFYCMSGKINNRGVISDSLLNITDIDISDNTLDIIQNIGLSVLSLLAGFKLSATGQNDETKRFFTNIYNTLGRY
jgi:hypothetical protein